MVSNVIRKAFVMSVYPDCHEEYKKRHDEIWSELTEVLSKHGASRYSIFLDEESNNLFAYVEIEDQTNWDKVAETDVCKRWWDYMKDIMVTNDNNSPSSKELKSVFFMK